MKVLKPTEKPLPNLKDGWRVHPQGHIQPADVKIYIVHSVLTEITDYSKTNLSRELGGVLVGGYYVSDGTEYIEIQAYIPAKLGESRSASFKFTHDSWSEIGAIKEARFPDKILVGWHHTHPTFGLFLSSMDTFIHQGYFNLPWQVAMVVDPCADNLAFFQWRGEKIVDCGFFVMNPVEVVRR